MGLRVGIVGTNFISDWFVAAAGETAGALEPVAVFSRGRERGEEFAAGHGLQLATDRLEDLIAAVDAVYVASPTGTHFSQAMAAIDAGRHVLVEKTMTANAQEAEALFAAAEAAGVVVMEATRNLHAPPHRAVKAALERIAPLRFADLVNLQYSSRYDRHRRGVHVNAFDPTLGNSAVADIGVYALEPALDWFGFPQETSGRSLRLDNGFEALGVILLDYGEMLANVTYGKIVGSAVASQIVGERGEITIDHLGQPALIELHLRGGPSEILWVDDGITPEGGMHHELEEFARQVERGETDPHWREISLNARRLMDDQLARSGA